MNKKFLVATALFTQLAAGAALACGDDTKAQWNAPAADAPAISIKEASEKLKTEKGVIVEESRLQSKCGPHTYTVTDAKDGQVLGEFPVPNEDDGRYLITRTEQVLGTSRDETKKTMARLRQAREDFYNDSEALEAELGVQMYDPNALPLTERFPEGKKALIYVTTEFCDQVRGKDGELRQYYSSSKPISQTTLLNTFEYIPGRTDYSEATIYQKGDAKKELLSNPDLFLAYKKRLSQNSDECQNRYAKEGRKWAAIENRLALEGPAGLMKSAYERYTEKFNIAVTPPRVVKSASLQNNNTINVTYTRYNAETLENYRPNATNLVVSLSGDVDDILRIEQDLARKGIQTDRETDLDYAGQAEKRYNQLKSPLPVGP